MFVSKPHLLSPLLLLLCLASCLHSDDLTENQAEVLGSAVAALPPNCAFVGATSPSLQVQIGANLVCTQQPQEEEEDDEEAEGDEGMQQGQEEEEEGGGGSASGGAKKKQKAEEAKQGAMMLGRFPEAQFRAFDFEAGAVTPCRAVLLQCLNQVSCCQVLRRQW